MRRWEQREAARTGKTIPEVLHGLIEQSGGRWEVIGAMANMTHQAAIRMFKRNGITKPKSKARNSAGGYRAEDDAKVKLRVCAEKFPFPLVVVWPKQGGFRAGWEREEL